MARVNSAQDSSANARWAGALASNDRRVPLQPTGNVGEYVAGVRYRAWQPPSALHPTIGVHAPLTFDLIDTWMERNGKWQCIGEAVLQLPEKK